MSKHWYVKANLRDQAEENVLSSWYNEMFGRHLDEQEGVDGEGGPPLNAIERAIFDSLQAAMEKELSRLKRIFTDGTYERGVLRERREANRLRMCKVRAAEPKEPITKKCAQCGTRFQAKRSTATVLFTEMPCVSQP